MEFKKATKRRAKLRLALVGPSGSGKTYTALRLAQELGEQIAVIDTEHGSASKYAGEVCDFDVLELTSFSPLEYVKALDLAAGHGYPVVIIDSLSHAWVGQDGALDQADKRGGKFQAWREITPQHNALVDAILGYPGHVISTMRAKTEYVIEKNDKGRNEVRKVGLAPVQRQGLEFEYDVVGDMDHSHVLTVTKSRCAALADRTFRKPGAEVAKALLSWLDDGSEPVPEQILKLAEMDIDAAKKLAREAWKLIGKYDQERIKEAFNAKSEGETA